MPLAVVASLVLMQTAAAPNHRPKELPEGVRYVPAADALNKDAKARLESLIAQGSGLVALAPVQKPARPLTTGAFITLQLNEGEGFDSSPFEKVTYRIELVPGKKPVLASEGLAAADAKSARALLLALDSLVNLRTSTRVRSLTAKELKLLSFFTASEITEPIFALELGKRVIIVALQDDGRSIRWIEDLTEPCFRLDGLDAPCLCAQATGRGRKLTVMFEEKASCGRETYQSASGKTFNVPGGMKEYYPSQPSVPQPDAPSTLTEIVLLTAEDEMAARIPVETLSGYIQQVEELVARLFGAAKRAAPAKLKIELTLEPGKKPIAVVAHSGTVAKELLQKTWEGVSGLAGPGVKGPVIFELHFSLWAQPQDSKQPGKPR